MGQHIAVIVEVLVDLVPEVETLLCIGGSIQRNPVMKGGIGQQVLYRLGHCLRIAWRDEQTSRVVRPLY